MINLSGKNIIIARGDSGDLVFLNPYGFEVGTYYFGVKRSARWWDPEEPYLFPVKTVTISSTDTQTLGITLTKDDSDKPVGTYTWGLRFVNGAVVDTLITDGSFQIVGSVVQTLT